MMSIEDIPPDIKAFGKLFKVHASCMLHHVAAGLEGQNHHLSKLEFRWLRLVKISRRFISTGYLRLNLVPICLWVDILRTLYQSANNPELHWSPENTVEYINYNTIVILKKLRSREFYFSSNEVRCNIPGHSESKSSLNESCSDSHWLVMFEGGMMGSCQLTWLGSLSIYHTFI